MAATIQDHQDGFTYTGARSETVGPKVILGGKYLFFNTAADTTSALQMKMPDGSFIAVGSTTNFTTSAATAMIDLPPGTYQIVIVSAGTNVAGGLVKIPYNPAY